ncbi:MAG: hypothetical protein ACTSR8_07575 [Promethearchaeota archaeon]
MSIDFQLIELLKEIEDVTDINGSFFINIEDNTVIESTIPFRMPEEIIWEIGVLIDTFKQFGQGVGHGDLKELMLEGDKGYIIVYTIPPHLILMIQGAEDINLSYVKLAMIDIISRIRAKIAKFGDDILKVPAKDKEIIAIEAKKLPTLITAQAEPAQVELKVESKVDLIETEQPKLPVSEVAAQEEFPEMAPVGPQETLDIKDMITNFEGKEKEIYNELNNIFTNLKGELAKHSGTELSNILDRLKDAILDKIGTSLALFDISKASRELSKKQNNLTPNEIEKYSSRIDNWVSRIIK